jgi:hypothetical protein
MDEFWAGISRQLAALRTARTADDVLRVLSREQAKEALRGDDWKCAGDGFFAGSGGDDTVMDALAEAGWTVIWAQADYYWVARAPNGDLITYCEGDIYRGDQAIRS